MQDYGEEPMLVHLGKPLLLSFHGKPNQINRGSAFVPKEIHGEIDGSIFALTGNLAEDNGTVAQFEAPPLPLGIPIGPADIFRLDSVGGEQPADIARKRQRTVGNADSRAEVDQHGRRFALVPVDKRLDRWGHERFQHRAGYRAEFNERVELIRFHGMTSCAVCTQDASGPENPNSTRQCFNEATREYFLASALQYVNAHDIIG
ncbi:hypothetical protein V2S84_24175 [Azotobacter chroococcum]|nr:hypothetical protein [Azotobacter chroococcum]